MARTMLDPEIEALLSAAEIESDISIDDIEELPSSSQINNHQQKNSLSNNSGKSVHEVDLSKTEFTKIEQLINPTPSKVYDDTTYYKTTLTDENASSQRLHQILTKYLTTTDQSDRTVYRQQIVTAYWELLRGMVPKMQNVNLPMPKRMFVRYGILLPSLFKPEQKDFFAKMIYENRTGEPVLYVDEWFKEISSGRMKNSMTDENKQPRKANLSGEEAAQVEQTRLMQLQSKNSGKLQSAENIVSMKENERAMLEIELKNRIDTLCTHQPIMGLEPHTEALTEFQRKTFSEITDILHRISKNDKELTRALEEFKESKSVYDSVQDKLSEGPQVTHADTGAVAIEFETVRQMAKMTVGRRGNQFPLFTREFYHCTENGTGTRENVIEVLRWIESIDPGCFHRIHKNIPNRIVPYVILVPTYGDAGFCWEPFDKFNRVTSRGRIVVPMYPRNLQISILLAVADLRWQVAKEKASYYWMEEGLTGQYYQWFSSQKIKGDVKEYFINDYILWMTKESDGVQKLDKEIRGIFWRHIPFAQDVKDKLRTRSLVYQELYQRDINRSMSDGY